MRRITDSSHQELFLVDLSHCCLTKRSVKVVRDVWKAATVDMVILNRRIGGTDGGEIEGTDEPTKRFALRQDDTIPLERHPSLESACLSTK